MHSAKLERYVDTPRERQICESHYEIEAMTAEDGIPSCRTSPFHISGSTSCVDIGRAAVPPLVNASSRGDSCSMRPPLPGANVWQGARSAHDVRRSRQIIDESAVFEIEIRGCGSAK